MKFVANQLNSNIYSYSATLRDMTPPYDLPEPVIQVITDPQSLEAFFTNYDYYRFTQIPDTILGILQHPSTVDVFAKAIRTTTFGSDLETLLGQSPMELSGYELYLKVFVVKGWLPPLPTLVTPASLPTSVTPASLPTPVNPASLPTPVNPGLDSSSDQHTVSAAVCPPRSSVLDWSLDPAAIRAYIATPDAEKLGSEGKEGITYGYGPYAIKTFVNKKKSVNKFNVEIQHQIKAAQAGVAPAVHAFDSSQFPYYIVMDRMKCLLAEAYRVPGQFQKIPYSRVNELKVLYHKLYQKGVAHNDNNALNLMLDSDDRLKIIDYGLAKKARANCPNFAENYKMTIYLLDTSFLRQQAGVKFELFEEDRPEGISEIVWNHHLQK